MISLALLALGTDLRRAAERRRYADVERLVLGVGTAAAQEAGTLPAGDARIGEIAAWLKDLFDRTEILLRIGRAAQASELRRVTFLKQYLSRPDRRASRVKMAG